MSELLTPEGTLALAIAVLELVLGWRFTLPERGRDLLGPGVFAAAVVVGFLAGLGYIPASPPWPNPMPLRIAGAVLLLGGLFLAGASSKARPLAGRGRLATGGPYAWIRHPLYVGLALALAGAWLRAPSTLGGLVAAAAAAAYAWLGVTDEQAAQSAFADAWKDYARRTSALLPTRSKR